MRGAHLLAVLLGAAQALSLGAEEVARAQGAGQPTPSLSPPTLQPSLPPPTPGPTIESNEPAPPVPETSPAASQAAPDPSQPNSAHQPPLAAAPDATDPVVAVIRSKLADPSQAKGADANDIAALGTFYASRTGKPLWITEMGFSAKGQAVIFEIEKADEWGLDAKTFVLPSAAELPASLEAQALAEIKLDLAILKYARYARGGRFVPSSISELYDQTPSLRDPKIVLAEIESADAPDRYLQLLHPKHEQFARLRQALLAARAPEEEEGGKQAGSEKDVRRIIINMERWRWMPEDLGSLYVWNNSPEFKLYLVKDGKPIFADKTLVGTIGYATPVFTADMKTIVFNPEWNAPETVVKENIWPPLQERNYSILRIHKLSVSYNGTPVDATRVDWRRVNPLSYTFSQKPGPHNNLGKVKFLFPNRHTVYMHDTLPVRKKYFKQTVRMIGHECVRMEKPAQFAEILLAEDKGWSASQVKDLWDKGVNSSVSIDKTIPVHMVYFTAVVDETGKVATWADVYGLDRKLAVALFGDATGFPQPPPESKQPGGEAGATAPAARRTTADNDIARAIQGFLGD